MWLCILSIWFLMMLWGVSAGDFHAYNLPFGNLKKFTLCTDYIICKNLRNSLLINFCHLFQNLRNADPGHRITLISRSDTFSLFQSWVTVFCVFLASYTHSTFLTFTDKVSWHGQIRKDSYSLFMIFTKLLLPYADLYKIREGIYSLFQVCTKFKVL